MGFNLIVINVPMLHEMKKAFWIGNSYSKLNKVLQLGLNEKFQKARPFDN